MNFILAFFLYFCAGFTTNTQKQERMNKIVAKEQFSEKVYKLVVEAPLIAKARRAGHFVIVRVGEKGERMPLTIADADVQAGTITLVVQKVGYSSTKLCDLNVGDELTDIVGPLGKATHIENFGTVICAGGGVGVAPMLPIIKALRAAGNRVVSVLAGRSKDLIILEDEVRKHSDEVIIMTDDGSYGQKGVVTVGIEQVIQRERVDKVFAIGPAIMMKFCCLLTKKYGISTDVSLNTIMVDGTGMCGACRITVGGKTRFVCVDGPEFDGHEVDFDEMLSRMTAFKEEEMEAIQKESPDSPPALPVREGADCSEQASASQESQVTAPSLTGRAGGESEGSLTDRNAPWRAELRASMKAKERTQIERVIMPELDPVYRATTRTEEVNQGLSVEQAQREAQRCLDCAKPTCMEGCPVNIQIPAFIKNIERGNFFGAAKVLKMTSALPAVCGRVCPQEKQCESRCIHLKMNEPAVAIGYLERFAADYERESGNIAVPECAPANGKKIAVVGSGPSGLLKYGIPAFRLPNAIVDVEIQNLEKMGVKFIKDCIIGKTVTVEELEQQGFAGIFVGSGAGLPNFMNIPGENLKGIMSSNEYLTRVNLMDASSADSDTPIHRAKSVMVVGGGNTAMDSCRTAKRLGAERVFIAYRRSEAEMPARLEEVKHAKEEGIEFLTLHNPIEYLADEQGNVRAVVLQKMELGEPDASGRRSPQPIPGATETIEIDQAIVAVGVSPNPIVPTSIEGLELGRKNTIVVNEGMQTNLPTIFAGGDIVRGGATVILAMGDGRRAAHAMHEYLSK